MYAKIQDRNRPAEYISLQSEEKLRADGKREIRSLTIV